MKHLTSTAVEPRENPSSIEEVASADITDFLVANDVETRVGTGYSGTEVLL